MTKVPEAVWLPFRTLRGRTSDEILGIYLQIQTQIYTHSQTLAIGYRVMMAAFLHVASCSTSKLGNVCRYLSNVAVGVSIYVSHVPVNMSNEKSYPKQSQYL